MTIKATKLESLDSLPIWLCIVRQEPIMNWVGCIRILVAEKSTLGGLEEFTRKYDLYRNGHPYGPNAFYMYFHREPDESPLKEMGEGAFLL